MSVAKKVIVGRPSEHRVGVDDALTLTPVLSKDRSPDIDWVWTQIDGEHSRRRNKKSHKLYVVTDGELDVVSESGKEVLRPGDVAVVPPNVWCTLHGRAAKVGIACTPGFDADDEDICEG